MFDLLRLILLMDEIPNNQLRLVVYPIIYRVSAPSHVVPGWDDLVAKKIEAPFKPAVKGATDTSASEMFGWVTWGKLSL